MPVIKHLKISFLIVIQDKLETLIANENQSLPVPDYEPYKLLREMRDEQDRNERTLVDLRRRILNPTRYSTTHFTKSTKKVLMK